MGIVENAVPFSALSEIPEAASWVWNTVESMWDETSVYCEQ
jgi:hypothetical protein